MLDDFVVFTRGGVVLWRVPAEGAGRPAAAGGDAVVNALIARVLLEERAGGGSGGGSDEAYDVVAPNGRGYRVRWALDNTRGLVLAATHERSIALPYVPALLERVRDAFGRAHEPGKLDYADAFDAKFDAIRADLEDASELTAPPSGDGGAGGGATAAQAGAAEGAGSSAERDRSGEGGAGAGSGGDAGAGAGAGAMQAGDGAFDMSKLNRRGKKGGREPPVRAPAKSGKPSKPAYYKGKGKGKGGKGDEEAEVLDYSQGTLADAVAAEGGAAHTHGASRMDDDSDDDNDDEEDSPGSGAGVGAWVGSVFAKVSGSRPLERADLAPTLVALKERLLTKNVAEEIAGELCASVEESLVGRRLPTFGRVRTAVREAMEAALVRILTPKRSNEILRDIAAKKASGEPYVMVFVGVNGVGKSTNLAKVAYWLTQNGMRVLLAACDTFRSGAVEQLRTHAARLDVPLFERGYEKDPANVAREAVKHARREGYDVVLVDTAGRMQDNEPLMVALSKLIVMNKPDTTLFVGEALTGNDALDQLQKFNSRLADLHPDPNCTRVIDGILLTKYETVDDKVGSALSMVYTSGAPIMFIGCGQTYTDLKSLNVREIVRALLA